MKREEPSIKFKEFVLNNKTYSAEDVVELIKIVESFVRDNFYINVKIDIDEQTTLDITTKKTSEKVKNDRKRS